MWEATDNNGVGDFPLFQVIGIFVRSLLVAQRIVDGLAKGLSEDYPTDNDMTPSAQSCTYLWPLCKFMINSTDMCAYIDAHRMVTYSKWNDQHQREINAVARGRKLLKLKKSIAERELGTASLIAAN